MRLQTYRDAWESFLNIVTGVQIVFRQCEKPSVDFDQKSWKEMAFSVWRREVLVPLRAGVIATLIGIVNKDRKVRPRSVFEIWNRNIVAALMTSFFCSGRIDFFGGGFESYRGGCDEIERCLREPRSVVSIIQEGLLRRPGDALLDDTAAKPNFVRIP